MASSVDVVIVGAGPYGLSLAAHLRAAGVDFRIFGDSMASWKHNMPAGMLLKSYPWATNLSDPASRYSVKHFCRERGLPYSDCLMPLPVESFIAYGEAFQAHFVPAVERKTVISLEPDAGAITAVLDDGEAVRARRVVVAVGLSSFKNLPATAHGLPEQFVSHSVNYGSTAALAGKRVAIVGAGSSATDLAALLREQGSEVTLVARSQQLHFASLPRPRRFFERAMTPMGGIGNGWTMRLCSGAPEIVHWLPDKARLRLAYSQALGPLGGAHMIDRVVGKVALRLGRMVERVKVRRGEVELALSGAGGSEVLAVDHVVFATGYRPNIRALQLFEPMVSAMRVIADAPVLSRHYETSVRGLHCIGPVAAPSFGPVCRFVHGTRFPARHLAQYLPGKLSRRMVPILGGQLAASGAAP